MTPRYAFIGIVSLLPWAALTGAGLAGPAHGAIARAGQPVMGTILQVTVIAADGDTARRLADATIAEARRWDDVLTTWRPEGQLARLNARAGAGPVTISTELATALQRMQDLSRATGGAFDPAVGPLVDLLRTPANTPFAAGPKKAGSHRIADALRVNDRQATLAAGTGLDAGGIGKGIALDAMAALLRAAGVEAAFLDFGGSSQLAIGAPPGEPAGWQVLIAGLETGAAHGVLHLRDAALSTSRATGAGAAAGPIIDPRTGVPAEAPRLATVLARDATAADVWSTALIVLGRDGLPRLTAASLEALYEDAAGIERTRGFPLIPIAPPLASRLLSPDSRLNSPASSALSIPPRAGRTSGSCPSRSWADRRRRPTSDI